MQYIVMWLVLQGVGLADTVWLSLVQGNALQTATINSATPNITGVNKLANNIFISSICTVTGQK